MLKQLHQLQKLQNAQKHLEQEKLHSETYCQMTQIKAEYDADKCRWQELAAMRGELLQNRKEYAEALTETGDKLQKEQDAMYDGSTSTVKVLSAREAQMNALTEKMESLKAQDEEAVQHLQQIEEETAELKRKIEEECQSFEKLKVDYKGICQEYAQKEAEVAAQIDELLPAIDKEELAWFEANRQRFGGSPVAYLSPEHVCDGCHTIVTPVLYKRTVSGQRTFCEKCGRALFTDGE
ncbi:MAG: hypothetical protein K6B40_03940 [Firmicutes bacterium]|nr:hypothetical protein [Bacillota bacterium]